MKKAVSKTLAIILSASLLFSALPFAFASDADTLKLVVATDTHYQRAESFGNMKNDSRYDPNNLYYHTTTQGQMSAESEAIAASFLDTFAAAEENILLIAGDLTNGERTDHQEFAERLAVLENQTGKKVFVIAGNHDIDDSDDSKLTTADEFKSIYAQFGYSEALSVDPLSTSYTTDLNSNYRLIAVDSCDYGKDTGKLDGAKLEWIKQQAETAKNDGKTLIALMHHSILLHFPLQDIIENYMELAEVFADMGIKYVFTGHMHGNDISLAVSKTGNMIYDVMTGSLITSPCSYRHVAFRRNAVDITTDYVTHINTAELPEGYTSAQLALINRDFPTYADGFFEAGMRYWINKRLGSAEVVYKSLNIEKDSKEYELLDDVMGFLGDSLNLPLYNTEKTPDKYDSVEEIIALYGYTMLESKYEYTYQIVARIMGSFFRGDEHITGDSAEIRIMFSVVDGCLTYALCKLVCGGNMTGVETLLNAIGVNNSCSLGSFSRKTAAKAANTIAAAILLPIVEGISNDAYSPDDINVTLDGTDVSGEKAESDVPLSKFKQIFSFIADFFRTLFSYIFKQTVFTNIG